MNSMFNKLYDLLGTTRSLDFLAPLALRLYLAPVFWMAGTQKLGSMESTIEWFGNPDWPWPAVPDPAGLACHTHRGRGRCVARARHRGTLGIHAADDHDAGGDVHGALAKRLAGDRGRLAKPVRQ